MKMNSLFGNRIVKVMAVIAAVVVLIPGTVFGADTNANTKSTAANANAKAQPAYSRGTYSVARDGSGNFTTITQAVMSVPSGSTLIIHEGIYNEALDLRGKIINMRGTSRDACVLQYDTADYVRVPLNIAGGTFENMTIKGYHRAAKSGAFSGYAIHIDSDTLAGQAVNFNNCNIISENAFCVGIGLRRGARIAFRGCNFTARKQGMMLFHDSQTPSLAGNASISVENCVINNSTESLVISQCISNASTTTLTFRNNTVIGVGDGGCLAYGSAGNGNGWMGASNVILAKGSEGNNIMSFNYSDMAKYNASLAQSSLAAVNKRGAANTGVSKSGKYYTIRQEDGTEVNVAAENIDEFSFENYGIAPGTEGAVMPEGAIQRAPQPQPVAPAASTISGGTPGGQKYYTILTEDGIEINVPAGPIDGN